MTNSPLPWTHSIEEGNDNYIRDANGKALMCDTAYYPWVTVEDFPFICRAVNAYPLIDELIARVVFDHAESTHDNAEDCPSCAVCILISKARAAMK